jgi:RHS repeat-associated protein
VARSGTDLILKRYRFTNKERDDERGLYYFGVRYYAAWLGRWTSSDPGDFVDGLNLYVYVRNNPVNGVDLEGYSTDPPPDCPDCPDAGRAWEQDNRIFYSEQEKKTFEVVPNLNGGYRWEL